MFEKSLLVNVENFKMNNASFTFGGGRFPDDLIDSQSRECVADFTQMCLYHGVREIYIFSISISCIWKELFTVETTLLTNPWNYFRVLLPPCVFVVALIQKKIRVAVKNVNSY